MGSPEPQVIERQSIPFVGIRSTVAMPDLARVAEHLPGLVAAVTGRGVQPTGPPFFRYETIDMAGSLTVTVGIPVPAGTPAPEGAFADELPAGDYAVLRHTGHPDELRGATAFLLAWAEQRSLRWDVADGAEGERWAGRIEFYETDPTAQPDPMRWTTQLAFKLADGQL